MSLLPTEPAHRLAERPEERRWLVEGLWADDAVGIVGGEPKCCKSFLALDLCVAVASGKGCLRRYPVPRPGRVLLYAAEDALHLVRRRLDGICRAAGVEIAALDVQVITAPALRLDVEDDRQRLAETVAALQPRLLVLDPFVRLHRIDENVSGEVAPLLAYLRELQRRHQVAVVLVHHARKGAARVRAGQALRGSSEFHAWGDSNLYLRRHGEQITLTVEHRAAPSAAGITLELRADGDALALAVIDAPSGAPAPAPATSVEERVERALATATGPLGVAELRNACRVRMQTLCDALAALAAQGRVRRTAAGYLGASR
ncbi:MAG: AAA family ATPase [Deltaproteobacteria bacterium]|nr:AAA family ATPase [Deltaproteobacteria bacterium]